MQRHYCDICDTEIPDHADGVNGHDDTRKMILIGTVTGAGDSRLERERKDAAKTTGQGCVSEGFAVLGVDARLLVRVGQRYHVENPKADDRLAQVTTLHQATVCRDCVAQLLLDAVVRRLGQDKVLKIIKCPTEFGEVYGACEIRTTPAGVALVTNGKDLTRVSANLAKEEEAAHATRPKAAKIP